MISYLLNYSFAAINPIILLVFNQNYRAVLLRKLNINVTGNKSIQKTVTTVRVNEWMKMKFKLDVIINLTVMSYETKKLNFIDCE